MKHRGEQSHVYNSCILQSTSAWKKYLESAWHKKVHMILLCVSLTFYHISIVNMFKNTLKNDWKRAEKKVKQIRFYLNKI